MLAPSKDMLKYVCACTGLVTQSCLILQPRQAPLSMGFSGQGYWSGLPFLSPGDLPNSEMELGFPALQAASLPLSHQGSPYHASSPAPFTACSMKVLVYTQGNPPPWGHKVPAARL